MSAPFRIITLKPIRAERREKLLTDKTTLDIPPQFFLCLNPFHNFEQQ